ncbi:MAG TPA: hypothetical protein VGD08_21120, partial [Stellaceae bacterium]
MTCLRSQVQFAVALALAIGCASAGARAAAPAPAPVTPELIAAAKKEGRVVFYTAVDVQVAE